MAIGGEDKVKKPPLKRNKPLNKVGKRGKRMQPELDKARKEALARDEYSCVLSFKGGCEGPLHVHHVRTRGAHPELRHTVTNLATLCQRHHDEAHRDMQSFQAWWEERCE
jgi:5-methylcytosine-specific restriction endonuclease McrA